MSNLRTQLIKLAYQNPELRGELLPLIKEGGSYNETVHERVQAALADRGIVSEELAVACVLDFLGKGSLPGYDMNGPRIPDWDCSFWHGSYMVDLNGLGTFTVSENGKVVSKQTRSAAEQPDASSLLQPLLSIIKAYETLEGKIQDLDFYPENVKLHQKMTKIIDAVDDMESYLNDNYSMK